MIEIPDSLRSLFSGTIEHRNGTYVIEVPRTELDQNALTTDEIYRVALIKSASATDSSTKSDASQKTDSHQTHTRHTERQASPSPPVDEGEVREVTIESIGDQGDGIAKVERGYVVIVPGAQRGDEPTIEVEEVKENVAFATIVETKTH